MGQLTQTTAQVQEFLDNVALNPMTAVGDLIVGGSNGNPVRLAKGTAGQVLMMNNSASAIEWGTPGGSGSGPTVIEMTVSGDIFEPAQGWSPPYSSSATFSFVDPNMTVSSVYNTVSSGEDVVATFVQNGTTFYMKPDSYGTHYGELAVTFSGIVTGSYADCYRCMLSMSAGGGSSDYISFYYTPYSYYSPY